jgi:sodium-dependent phosphate cotransporter
LGGDMLGSFFQVTENPFVALVVGILATTLVQSSSVTTSMVVALVAAPDNPLPIQNAIPMIMGANIGTTVTNTIVALGHMSRPEEFRRAYAAATCHDFFNFIAVAVLLPLEILTGYLAKASWFVSGAVGRAEGAEIPNPLKAGAQAMVEPVQEVIATIIPGEHLAAAALIAVSMSVIFLALFYLVRLLREVAASRVKTYLGRALDASPYIAMGVGVVTTAMVQSSSITTSILVPLAGARIVTLRQIFPVTLGANLGTTVTALVASMAAPPETARLAVQIAVVHLLFNLSAIALIFPVESIRKIPLQAARALANSAVRSKKIALLYLVCLFYALPALLMAVTSGG